MAPGSNYDLTPVEHDPWAEAQTHQAERPNPAAPIVETIAKRFRPLDLTPMHLPGTQPKDYLRELSRNPDTLAHSVDQAGAFNFGGVTGGIGGKLAPFMRPVAPTYSALGAAVQGAKQSAAQPDQWLGFLKNQPGVKAQEIEHVGLESWLKGQQGPVSRESVGEFVQGKQPEIREVRKGADDARHQAAEQASTQARQEWLRSLDAKGEGPETSAAYQRYLDAEQEAVRAVNEKAAGAGTKFSQYQLPGGSNYGETLLTLPKKSGAQQFRDALADKYEHLGGNFVDHATQAEQDRLYGLMNKPRDDYKSSHWDESNVLLHTRHNDRTVPGPNGEPMNSLHLEEIQSDWHQAGRKAGYRTDPTSTQLQAQQKEGYWEVTGPDGEFVTNVYNAHAATPELAVEEARRRIATEPNRIGRPSKVPDAPFKTTWPDLALKRMLHRASTERNPDGSFKYDALSWTPGEAQAARYDLSKQVDSLQWRPDTGELIATKGGAPVIDSQIVPREKLADTVGKEAADRLVATSPAKIGKHVPGLWHSLEGNDLKVGGEGMKSFYDKMLPDKANALVKKYGAKVERSVVDVPRKIGEAAGDEGSLEGMLSAAAKASPTKKEPIHLLRITPALRAAAEKGFPTFAIGGAAALGNYSLTPVDHDPFSKN